VDVVVGESMGLKFGAFDGWSCSSGLLEGLLESGDPLGVIDGVFDGLEAGGAEGILSTHRGCSPQLYALSNDIVSLA